MLGNVDELQSKNYTKKLNLSNTNINAIIRRAGQYYNIIVNCDIKHHNNRYRREIFSIVISVAQYYHQYHEYCKVFA